MWCTNKLCKSLALTTCNTTGIHLADWNRRPGRKTQSPVSSSQPWDNHCPGSEAVWQQSVSKSLSGVGHFMVPIQVDEDLRRAPGSGWLLMEASK